MTTILAIDPGSGHSGWVVFNQASQTVSAFGTTPNAELVSGGLSEIITRNAVGRVRCEMIAHYGTGMPAGRDVFDTCVWIGRLQQTALHITVPFETRLRSEVKMALCGSMRAKDGNVRQAVIDRLGPPGTKRAPGKTYGISGHVWQALALALLK